ncbi:hypothetical protein BC829DRAFT_162518 [Chytridium lagenaria]|nr:hypothetical protein BC829DRAFT_162518 [Chytridium lagenaria]
MGDFAALDVKESKGVQYDSVESPSHPNVESSVDRMMSFEEIVSREGGGRQGTVDLDAFLAGGEGEMENMASRMGLGPLGERFFRNWPSRIHRIKGAVCLFKRHPEVRKVLTGHNRRLHLPFPESKGKDQNEQGRVDTIRSAAAEEDMFASTHATCLHALLTH